MVQLFQRNAFPNVIHPIAMKTPSMLLLALSLSECANKATKPASHNEWVLVSPGPFDFLVPPDMREQPAVGMDSMVGKFEGEEISLSFDYAGIRIH